MNSLFHNKKSKVVAIHAALYLVIALFISIIVFHVWFPGSIAEISGIESIYLLLITVDFIFGPTLTLIVWNTKKSRRKLFIDTTIVITIQLAALGYGMMTIYQNRPVYIVFETDRLRMVNAAEIAPEDLEKASDHWKNLPRLGPKLLSTRVPKDGEEMLRSIDFSIAGKEPSVRPEMWEEYTPAKKQVRAASRSLPELLAVYPEKKEEIIRLAEKFNVPYACISWLPFTSVRSMDWVALIDTRTVEPFTYIQGDGFIPRHR